MRLLVLHLSDIHISTEKWPDNPVINRVKDKVHVVFLPGNHDCNFATDTAARRRICIRGQLIANADPSAIGDGSIIDICTSIQKKFFSFCQRLSAENEPTSGPDRMYREHRLTLGSEEILVRVLNSAWDSELKEKPGTKPGTLSMPVKIFEPKLSSSAGESLLITALHHPYGWYEPNNARALRRLLESTSDLIFTGHEHVAESYAKTGSVGEHNEYVEAGAFARERCASKQRLQSDCHRLCPPHLLRQAFQLGRRLVRSR